MYVNKPANHLRRDAYAFLSDTGRCNAKDKMISSDKIEFSLFATKYSNGRLSSINLTSFGRYQLLRRREMHSFKSLLRTYVRARIGREDRQ